MSVRWTKDSLPREPQTRPIDVPAEPEGEPRRRRWIGTGLAVLAVGAASYAAGYLWGQEGVNHALGLLIIFLLLDRAWLLDGSEEAREQADEARQMASETLDMVRRVHQDTLALARLFYGEADETTTGRHGRRD